MHRSNVIYIFCVVFLLLLTSCANGATISSGAGTPTPNIKQTLTLPAVGTQDIGYLDPTQAPNANNDLSEPDFNSSIIMGMLYSGLVKLDKNLTIQPDQATWELSKNDTVYTFHLKPDITFSDGTPVTAHTYVYTLTRALLPSINSELAPYFEQMIVGASDVNAGKTTVLRGVKAIDNLTLQITLTQPTAYFLYTLSNALFFPLNQKLIEQYGDSNWTDHIAGNGAGTGPFMLKELDHNVRMVLVPNPYYYGQSMKLTEVDMVFVVDPLTAFKSYRAGQYDLIWNIDPSDLLAAKATEGFTTSGLFETDLLFFNNKMPPFDNVAVRQAFAAATDKETLVHSVLLDSATPAPTIIPPGTPGYQTTFQGIPFNATAAKNLLLSAYPDLTTLPPITFSYPNSEVSQAEATALQGMWQRALGIHINLNPVQVDAYSNELAGHEIQFGYFQWTANFPDPYDWLTENLSPGAANNYGDWNNASFVQFVTQAEQSSDSQRLMLYSQAEQIVLQDAGWLPLDHLSMAAIIPSWVHGISLTPQGFYFGDWSGVFVTKH